MTQLALAKIKLDGGTQSRAMVDDVVVADYAQTIRDGTDLPPIVVFFDGKTYWLADGFHRHAAYCEAGAVDIEADVRQGTQRDAILFSVGANAAHGLRRSKDDKRRSAMTLLDDDEWANWSNREIARRASVSEAFVRSLRAERSDNQPATVGTDSAPTRAYTTKHGTPAVMKTGKIGKPALAAPATENDAFDLYAVAGKKPAPPSRSDEIASKLTPAVQEMRKASAARKPAAKSAQTAVKPEDDPEELRNIIASQQDEIADLRRKFAKYDGMAAEYEKGGFAEVIAGLEQRIEALTRQVERESQEKLKNLRSAEYWKGRAKASPNVAIDVETGAVSDA